MESGEEMEVSVRQQPQKIQPTELKKALHGLDKVLT